MRTFHTGGVAGADITHGLPRVVELFEARKPKGLARIAEVSGTVSMEDADKQVTVVITDSAGEEHRYTFPRRTILYVRDGQRIEQGTPLNEGSLYPHEILAMGGKDQVQRRTETELGSAHIMSGDVWAHRGSDPGRGMSASDAEAREFAAAFRAFLEWLHGPIAGERDEVAELVQGFLGREGSERSVVTRSMPVFEHVNLQTSLDAWSSERGREVSVQGLMLPPHHGGVTLQQLVFGAGHHGLRLSPPPLVDLANGPDSTLACLRLGLLMVSDELGRYLLMVNGPNEHDPSLGLEIAGLEVQQAQAVHARLEQLRRQLNVYRGHVLDISVDPMGGVVLAFGPTPATAREDVVLPEPVLARVERHALGVATHRDALLAAGQHLKRGLLLYGPPGTGKTHTTRYLVGRMAGYTRLILTGRALHAIGSAAELARDLQPGVVVLEDVDLIAEDRSFGRGASPVLFDLLDAMDGAAPDADLLFVLTTNRADLLEPALAARPGRVDVAVEINLPDAEARQRLLALYGRSLPLRLDEAETRDVVERTDGVTASFLKELLRRAMLETLQEDMPEPVVTATQVSRALADLLDSTQALTRSLLGVGNDPGSLPAGGGLGSLPPQGRAWMRAQAQSISLRRRT